MIVKPNLLKALQKTEGLLKRKIFTPTFRWHHTDDPLEQIYLEKLEEYNARSSGGRMFEPTKEILAELESELNRIAHKYGAENGSELEEFPNLEFDEPEVDPILGGFKFDKPKTNGNGNEAKDKKEVPTEKK